MVHILVFIYRTSLLVTMLAVKQQSKGDCGDDVRKPTEGQDCCSNYHMVNGGCEACPAGYFGDSCFVKCPYPSFGLFCGDTCNCSQSECDPAFGCRKFESSPDPEMITYKMNYSGRHLITQTFSTTHRPSIIDATTELSSQTLTLIIGGVVILFLLVIIIIQVHGKINRRKNSFKKKPLKIDNKPLQNETSTNSMYCEIDEGVELSVPRARYESLDVNSPSLTNRNYDIPLIVIHPDVPQAPLGLLQKDTTRSFESDDSSNETSGSNSSSSDGSYLKPSEKAIKNTQNIDTEEGHIIVNLDDSTKSLVHSLNDQGVQNGTSINAQDNPYLDVIS